MQVLTWVLTGLIQDAVQIPSSISHTLQCVPNERRKNSRSRSSARKMLRVCAGRALSDSSSIWKFEREIVCVEICCLHGILRQCLKV